MQPLHLAIPADTKLTARKNRAAHRRRGHRHLAAASAAVAMIAGLGMAAAAPASAVFTVNCTNGRYNLATGNLHATSCGPVGTFTNVRVQVSDLATSGTEEQAALTCPTYTVGSDGTGSGLCGPPHPF